VNYYERARALATKTTKPTLTDQSQARSTDINIIVPQFMGQGTAPGKAGTPMYEDFSELPRDLRGFIEEARELEARRAELPEALRAMDVAELLALPPDKIKAILTPAEPTPAPTPEPPKGEK